MGYDEISTEEWEERCRGCGSCCFEKIEDERGTIFYLMSACRYLDLETRQCKVYENRFTINPECVKLTPELVKNLRWLPKECGYLAPPPSLALPVLQPRKRPRRRRK